jgi:nickel transport protein
MSRMGDRWAALLVAGTLAAAPGAALAHGAQVEARAVEAIAVSAVYDTGEPMAGAQVSVFAPDDPMTPWLQGVADESGRFVFVPDAQAGRWTVQARHAGHGTVAHVVRGADRSAASGEALPVSAQGRLGTPLQRSVMAACVIWGFVGTALYFRRRTA